MINTTEELKDFIVKCLEDKKADDILVIGLDFRDYIVNKKPLKQKISWGEDGSLILHRIIIFTLIF